MRDILHPNIEQLNLPTILNALGDPVRLEIIKSLSKECEITCSCCNVNLQKSALSHHFKVLREAGIINVRIEGKQRFLSLRKEELEKRFPGILDSVIKNINLIDN